VKIFHFRDVMGRYPIRLFPLFNEIALPASLVQENQPNVAKEQVRV
jgi:hypothetical protein